MNRALLVFVLLAPLVFSLPLQAEAPAGYYRFPAIHGDTLVFTAEGDLWTVGAGGGEARRLTSHPGQETHAAISPDGRWVAFTAEYEGAGEVYVMPLAGGLPKRLTWDGQGARTVGWTPDGRVLYATGVFTTLPSEQLVAVHPESLEHRLLPLAQATDGTYDASGSTLFFNRLPFHGSYTKRYQGGAAQRLWSFTEGAGEARLLTGDFPGVSVSPMWWAGRVYFVTDRDGTRNLWSMGWPMGEEGADLRQHTAHKGWDVKQPDLGATTAGDGARIVYQLGADLHLFDLSTGEDRKLAVTLPSDFDQRRVRWVKKPMDYLTSAHLSPNGDRVVLTARGEVFVAPVGKGGRWVEASRASGVRYRSARFLPGSGKRATSNDLVVLSDESGEVELWQLDARGVRAPRQLSEESTVLRFDTLPSPDGGRIAYLDKRQELWVFDVASGTHTQVARSDYFGFAGISWSPDGQYLAYSLPADNFLTQIWIFDARAGESHALTSDRFNNGDPAWSRDGRFLYFLSDRHLVPSGTSVWGSYHPGPFLDRTTRIYVAALRDRSRSPFAPKTELDEKKGEDDAEAGEDGEGAEEGEDGEKDPPGTKDKPKVPRVEIDFEGLPARIEIVPGPLGNYGRLAAGEKALFYLDRNAEDRDRYRLLALEIDREGPEPVKVAEGLVDFELSADGQKVLLREPEALTVIAAEAAPLAAEKRAAGAVALAGWTFALDPKEEWKQMLTEAWRLLRDYFYDPNMHGVDWLRVLDKYRPLVARITDRAELSDLFAEMTGELATLHHYVYGGEFREGEDAVRPASLGAILERDAAAGGWRVAHIYPADPDMPEELSPLARPGVWVREGEVITAINGVATLSVAHPGDLLRNQAGKQVLLAVSSGAASREVIVEPLPPRGARELRYDAWEYERRRLVEEWSDGKLGYVHLRSMGNGDYTSWARHFFPVYHRPGLIVDVRNNNGGNIDSWILGSLLRPAWMWWKPRVGTPYRNMQFAFDGHAAVLINELTYSDGEAFAEGFRRLGVGKVFGARSWGGEIWLTSSNLLVDNGIATAAEYGVYGPEGEWLIEGHGVEPDVAVDNLPHATFGGEDAQLRAAVEHVLRRIEEDPPGVPPAPPYPDKSHPDWP